MNNKWIEYGQDLLVMIMNHLYLTAIAVGMVGLFREESPHFGIWAATFVLPVAFYVIRERVRWLVPFLMLHLLIPAASLLLPISWVLRGIVLAVAVIYALLSLKLRFRENAELDQLMTPLGAIGTIGAVSLVDYFISKNGWEQYYLVIAALYLCLYFVTYFIGQYLFLRVVNKSSVGVIPERAIFSTGMRQTVLFSLGSMAILFLTANIGWVSYLLSWIWKGLYEVLAVLVSWIPKGDSGGAEDTTGSEVKIPSLPGMEEIADNPWVKLFWQVLEVLVSVALIILFTYLIVRFLKGLIKFLRDSFARQGREKNRESEEWEDVRENCALEKTGRETAGLFSYFSNRERIRRIFRKKVLKHKENIIGKSDKEELGYMTAGECCLKLPEEKDASEVLKEMYEKARYSPEEVTAEDVRRVKAGR